VIEVVFNRGIHLPELNFWLDPWDVKESAFISHAHADHFARHGHALCSSLTAKLLRARFNMPEARMEGVDFGQMIERDGFRLRILPAGHIAGSAMLHVTRKSDGATLLYTGDFKTRRARTAEPVNFMQADTLIMETTFGLPHLIFPNTMEVDAAVLRFVHNALADGETPILLGYSLGKAQEALALLAENGIPVLSHPKVAEMTDACRAAGIWLPESRVFEGFAMEGYAVIAPPNTVSSKLLRGIKKRRTAMLTGWAFQPGSIYRYRVDEVIPMSDHADHAGLHECVTRVRPKRVLTVHGFTKEYAAELRDKGIDAWCAMGGDQLELSLGKPHSPSLGTNSPRHSRPICQLADFSDVCRLIGETSSRLEKVDFLVGYLRGLSAEDLEIATRWLIGEALPRRLGKHSLILGNDAIKRTLLSIPGVKIERFQQIAASQNDMARTTKMLLQEIFLSPNRTEISDLRSFFLDLEKMKDSLEMVDLLAKRLFDLHPSEAELVIKILTGDLRIDLKQSLVEVAIAKSFQADDLIVHRASILTGDLGQTAVLAKEGRLSDAKLMPLVPIRFMLASPLEQEDCDEGSKFTDLPFPPPIWLEADCAGIRAQLHKLGSEVGLFSRDLRPLNNEFPELIEAALELPGDFILDGELIAYAEGRKLSYADLQKRTGTPISEGDLFMLSAEGTAPMPLKYVAFDLLWVGGESLLECPLKERRERLETIPLTGMFGYTEIFRADDYLAVEAIFSSAIQTDQGLLIAKDPESAYLPGRRVKSWISMKNPPLSLG
jgi:DNA ligase 1